MMITLTYVHDHQCSHMGEEIEVRPLIQGGAYFGSAPKCVELHAELTLLKKVVE